METQFQEPHHTPETPLSLQEQLNIQQEALTKIYTSVEKTRKYILWSGIASFVFFILPLFVVGIALPFIMKTFVGSVAGFNDISSSIEASTRAPSLSESLENLKNLGF